ncbi:efflux RND transporter periplasmic adaptor subunit [Salinisphaera aquimarina]|uniref:Efflux RND transporter periplasmic adaptor subunit n=1 Tax=Salinisphaera aquimarina TaxID=2094031 RepID=A0ABV7EJZ3_9GAMM
MTLWRHLPGRVRRRRFWLCLLLALAINLPAVAADDDGDDAAPAADVPMLQVVIPAAVQSAAGIATQPLAQEQRRVERRALATVLSLQPLLARRADLLAARADVSAARARFSASDDAYQRLRRLTGGRANVSARELAGVRATQRVDGAQLQAAEAHLDNLRVGLRHVWGPVVAQWLAAEQAPPPWQAILDGEQVLATLRMPADMHLASAPARVLVAADERRTQARQANVLSAAPEQGTSTPGETWLLRLPAQGLHAGMRLSAWVAQDDEAHAGVLIPASAVVWQDGRPWAYVQIEDDRFARRPLPPLSVDNGDARFVSEGFAAGDAVVTAGAQMLLGEELRAQIPEEDDD